MFQNNNNYPYPSRRMAVYGKNGMVATSQPLAALAGLDILKKGGNAIDAAIATAAMLTVTEPTSNGIGSDAFALVWTKGKLHGLNASGPAPKAISIDALHNLGFTEIPRFGFVPVTVPGAPGAWAKLSETFGSLPLKEVMKPAIGYARYGYPVSPTTATGWKRAYQLYRKQLTAPEFSGWFETFAKDGKTPETGDIAILKDHADTLEKIADSNGEAFYRGDLADQIDDFSKKYGGFIRKTDLKSYYPEWVDPIHVNYRGYDIWEIPPNGQGIIALMALNILKGFEFSDKENPKTVHLQIEAMKMAFSEGLKSITDSRFMNTPISELLSDNTAARLRNSIGKSASNIPCDPAKGGTVYLCAADKDGNMVSYIQSNYMGFGSGLVVPNTGIALQNRGHNFSLNPNHINSLSPGKRTYHTIIPGFVTKGEEAIGPFGVMGGFMQPQGHVQVLMNCIDFGLNPQSALDAPRWQWIKDRLITVEQSFPNHILKNLSEIGHQIQVEYDSVSFGRGQIIWRNPETKVYVGGSEPRTDGIVAAW